MKYRAMGKTGLVVSEVCLGTMQFGRNRLGSLDQMAATEMVRFAVDKGINFIDTADVYSRGESEMLLGNALRGIREEIVLATKFRLPMSENINRCGATRVNIMRSIESSLKRLQTDYIDLYQVHSWDQNTPLEETVRSLDDLVRHGKVRYIGLSNYYSWQTAAAIELQKRLGLEKYVTAQMHYSLVERGLEHEFLALAEYYGIGILVWSPLAGGFLTGKYERNHPAPKGTRFGDDVQFVPFDMEQGYRVIEALNEISRRHTATPARVALAWLLAKPAVSSVIIAARNLEHLQDDIKAVELDLGKEDIKALDSASDTRVPYPKWILYQQGVVEDPRTRIFHPELYPKDEPLNDLRREWRG